MQPKKIKPKSGFKKPASNKPRTITKMVNPPKNRFLAEKERLERKNKLLNLLAKKFGVSEKEIERRMVEKAAKNSLKVKK